MVVDEARARQEAFASRVHARRRMRGSLGVESEVRVESEEQLSLVPAQVGLAGAPLTAREREVVALLCAGLNNTEIARALFVSIETVKTHLKASMAKTGARNRTHLAALAGRASYLAHLSDSRSGSPLLVS
jgi:DNA-binding CsgD family transcriptional regulator